MTTYHLRNESGIEVFTGTISPAPGGSQPVNVARVPVSSAEILALGYATSKTIVVGVPNKMIWPLTFAVTYLAGGTPYTDTGGALSLVLDPAGNAWSMMNTGLAMLGVWDQATNQVYADPPADIVGPTNQSAANVGGQNLGLVTLNPPTGGNGTLIVTVTYILIDLA